MFGEPIPAVAKPAWIVKAADAGSLWAAIQGARLLADKDSELYDSDSALRLARLAVAAGHDELFLLMGNVCFEMEPVDWATAKENYMEYRKRVSDREELSPELRWRLWYSGQFHMDAEHFYSQAEEQAKGKVDEVKTRETDFLDENGDPRYETRLDLDPPAMVRARVLYEIALKKGHPAAAKALAGLDDEPSAADREEAVSLLNQAAELAEEAKRSAQAARKALTLYYKSYCLDSCAREGEAAYQLMLLYQTGQPGVEKSSSRYWEWSRLAAEAGNPRQMRSMASHYAQRKGPNKDKALDYARKLLANAASTKDPDLWDIIAMAHARNDLFEQAVKYQLKAIEIATHNKYQKRRVPEYQQRLSLYRSGKPFPELQE